MYFDQINTALMNIRDLFKRFIKKTYLKIILIPKFLTPVYNIILTYGIKMSRNISFCYSEFLSVFYHKFT